MAVGGDFHPYLQHVAMTLTQAALIPLDVNDPDMVEYVNEVRESVCEAYIGIVQGLSDEKRQDLLVPYLGPIFQFLSLLAEDKDREIGVTRSCVALIGDLASNLQAAVAAHLRSPFISQLIQEGLENELDDAPYTQQVVAKCLA